MPMARPSKEDVLTVLRTMEDTSIWRHEAAEWADAYWPGVQHRTATDDIVIDALELMHLLIEEEAPGVFAISLDALRAVRTRLEHAVRLRSPG